MAEPADDQPVESVKHKTCVLKASIHCEGCKRKVKKILSQVQGVEFVDVDTKLQKVTVVGSVEADALIKRLVKAGKHAELWPEKTQKKEKNPSHAKVEEKPATDKQKKIVHNQQTVDSNTEKAAAKELEPSEKLQVDAKNSKGSGGAAKSDGGAGKSGEEGGGGATESVKSSGGVEETKSETKKTDASFSEGGEIPQPTEKTNGGGGGGEGGTSGKKKKKKGQTGKLSSSAPTPAPAVVSENHEPDPPLPTNHCPPRHPHHPPTLHHYYTPPPPPVYGLSYNTTNPTSSYTTSYYTAPPPYSYAYAYPGPAPPPPSDQDYPRQPLDSFELFSDENPNGCSVA